MSIVPRENQSVKINQPLEILGQFGINLTLGFGTLVLFSFLRPRNVTIYSPKQFAPKDKQPPKIEENKLWGWVKPVLKADDSSLLKEVGLDAVMFIRFIRLCRDVCLCLFVFGACIIMPIHCFGAYDVLPEDENPLQYLSVSYLKEVKKFSIFAYLFSFYK
jgi:calcium permeable stress-gated cation channel